MSDDLIKRLLHLDMHPESAPRQAADRIKYLEAERDVLREGIFDALGRYQVTHIHAALRNTMSNVERRS